MKKLATILILIMLTGCGTTLSESVSTEDLLTINKTQSLSADNVTLTDNSYPNDDTLQSANPMAVEPYAIVTVYNNSEFKKSDLVTYTQASANGSFLLNLGAGPDSPESLYIVVSVTGETPSDPLILERN